MTYNTRVWKDFVNDFLFANYEKLEYFIVNRSVSDNGMIINYIQFPKEENGTNLTEDFVKFIVQSIEADEKLMKQIFGPAYEKGSAEIQNDINDISILWNVNYYEDVKDEDDRRWYELYDWDVYEKD